jgi:hypothetical protein
MFSSVLSPTWLVIVAYTNHGNPSIPAGLTGVGEARAKVRDSVRAGCEVRVLHLVYRVSLVHIDEISNNSFY